MAKNGLQETIVALITPLIESMGIALWGLDISQGPRTVVRIYVDAPDGVTVDQCAKVSRHIGLTLEVEDLFRGAYTLEVSSPGLERPFFSLEQLAGYEGSRVESVLYEAHQDFPGRRKFQGIVSHVADNTFALKLDDNEEIVLNWDDVKKARLVHVFPDQVKGKKKGK